MERPVSGGIMYSAQGGRNRGSTRGEIGGEISSGRGLDNMLTMVAMAADALGRTLAKDFRRTFGSVNLEHAERLDAISRVALECLGRSDALYHSVEHTLLVTLVARDILHGRMLTERIEPDDYAHLIVACLLHDIGYVRGVLRGDGKNSFIVNEEGKTV